jgi:hypothetical protein
VASCSKFEFGMGLLLANAWLHKEALQTTDLPLLVGVAATIMADDVRPPQAMAVPAGGAGEEDATAASAAGTGVSASTRPLASIVCRFLLAIGRNFSAVGEARVVGELLKQRLFELIFVHMGTRRATLHAKDVAVGLEGLAMLLASEEFQTAKARAVQEPAAIASVLRFRENVLDEHCEEAADRKKLRPLLDFCAEMQRKAKAGK